MTSPSIYSTEKILLVNDPVIDDEYPNHNDFFSPTTIWNDFQNKSYVLPKIYKYSRILRSKELHMDIISIQRTMIHHWNDSQWLLYSYRQIYYFFQEIFTNMLPWNFLCSFKDLIIVLPYKSSSLLCFIYFFTHGW